MTSSHKPSARLLMFKGHIGLNFCTLEDDEWINVEEHPQEYRIFVIERANARIYVATWDKSLTYSHAQEIAINFVFGTYDEITVNLKTLEGRKEKGQPFIHPPY